MEKLTNQPSRFNTLRDTNPQPTNWEAIVQELQDTRYRAATRHYREVCVLLEEAEIGGDAARIEELKQEKVRLKTEQSAFIPSVVLQGGRSSAHIIAYTDIIMVDIDEIAPEQFDAVLEKVRADKHTCLEYVTLSGLGIRILAKVDVEVTKQNFGKVWQQVNDYYANLTGVAVDRQCKNATRMSVLCYDPDVLYRPDAEPMPVSVWLKQEEEAASATPKRKVGRPVTIEKAFPTVKRLVEEDGIRYAPGSHNAYISRCLYWMNRFGVSEPDAQVWALQTFADYDAVEHSVAATVRSCYALTGEHGTCSLRTFAKRGERQSGRPSSKATVEEMEAFVSRWGEFRMNRLINQLEFRFHENDWQRMTDQTENSLWRAMQHEGLDTDVFRIRTLLQSDFVKDYHPLREYLDQLPPWDGKTDYIGQFAGMVHCKETSVTEFAFYFQRWLVGLLAGALHDNRVNHVIFVLLGPQGSFKSSFMSRILPPELHRYYTVKVNSQRMNKDDALAMTENLLINFEELDSMQRSELNQLKALCTAEYIDERPAYGRNKVHLPHVASFCGTGNNLQLLTDDSGSRRFLLFEVERIDNPWMAVIPYEGIYSQAKALLESGYRYWFDQSEVDELNDRNHRFEAPNPARELVSTFYRKPLPHERAKYITASAILLRFGNAVRISTVQIGKAMKELGFEQKHTTKSNYWIVADRSSEEINHELPETE